MRHAESEERRGVRDHDRAITEQGAATARQVHWLVAQGWSAALASARCCYCTVSLAADCLVKEFQPAT